MSLNGQKTESMRQQGSAGFIDVLNALRIGKLRSEHLAIVVKKVSKDFTDKCKTIINQS